MCHKQSSASPSLYPLASSSFSSSSFPPPCCPPPHPHPPLQTPSKPVAPPPNPHQRDLISTQPARVRASHFFNGCINVTATTMRFMSERHLTLFTYLAYSFQSLEQPPLQVSQKKSETGSTRTAAQHLKGAHPASLRHNMSQPSPY